MTWLIAIWRWIATSRAGRAVGAAIAVLAALGLARAKWRSDGHREAEREAQDDARDRVEKGNEAVSRNRGDDPADRLRRNDGRW